MCMMEKEAMLKEVAALGFALDDALLYLDTHVCDAQALCYYQEMQAQYNAARERYIACFGPLQQNEIASAESHTWIQTAWPWEVEG